MAFLTFSIMSGGIVFIPCTSLACCAILVMSSASVAALVSNGQDIPVSLHLNDGISSHLLLSIFRESGTSIYKFDYIVAADHADSGKSPKLVCFGSTDRADLRNVAFMCPTAD
jgi:hypothetical protein